MAVDVPVQPQTEAAPATRERFHFTQREYYAMVKAGVLNEDSRVELIQGDIISMSPINARHSGTLKRLNRLFTRRLPEWVVVGVQDPIIIGNDTEPLPDISICKARADDYTKTHPDPKEILWVVEVADSSVRYDRETKGPLYAAAGIAEYWLLDLTAGALEVYRTPSTDGYKSILRLKPGDQVSPLAFPDLILEVAALLPPTEHGS